MTQPLIALVINYRDARRTASCIHSLLGDAINRCVVWDNSGDGGVSAGELSLLLGNETRVDIVVSTHNLGFAAGVNCGLSVCSKLAPDAWVLLINNDALAPVSLAQVLRDALESQSAAVLAFPALKHVGQRLDEVYYQRWLGLITTRPRPGAFRLPRGCCLMLATDRWEGPLFDEDFFMYGEEIALGWTLRDRPEAMHLAASVCVEHEGSASSGVASPFYEERTVAAHLILTRKLARNRLEAWLLLALKLPLLILRAMLRTIRFRSLVPLRALGCGWRIYGHVAKSAGSSSSGRPSAQ